MAVALTVLNCHEIESVQSEWIRKSSAGHPPEAQEWLQRRAQLVSVLQRYAKDDESQSDGRGDFFVGDEWERANYLPVVARTWTILRKPVVTAIRNYLASISGNFVVSIVRPFPTELWGLLILITATETRVGCLDESPEKVQEVLRDRRLYFLAR